MSDLKLQSLLNGPHPSKIELLVDLVDLLTVSIIHRPNKTPRPMNCMTRAAENKLSVGPSLPPTTLDAIMLRIWQIGKSRDTAESFLA